VSSDDNKRFRVADYVLTEDEIRELNERRQQGEVVDRWSREIYDRVRRAR
jgi:hypothetical protein